MNLAFTLDAWAAWAPDRPRRADWLAWARGEALPVQTAKPDVSVVPPLQRRRMSFLSRMAFASAIECCAGLQVAPCCIFASRHGELARTVQIIHDIVDGTEVSPTDFSLSVFNTALGLYSIFTDNHAPSTMVVAGEDTFGAALIEAHIYLSRFPEAPVLLVFFDEPLPSPLDVLEQPPGEAFSIALLLSAGASPTLAASRACNPGGLSDQRNPGLDFLQFLLSDTHSGAVRTQRSLWQWRRL